jgi:hypothetical protein
MQAHDRLSVTKTPADVARYTIVDYRRSAIVEPMDMLMTTSIVEPMAMTSMQIDGRVRDELASVAASDFGGVPLGEAVRRLLREHKVRRVMDRYAELQADPDEWADYQAEVRLTTQTAGEALPFATDEYPEYNR